MLGHSTALEIFLTGKQYEGHECVTMGFVNHLVEQRSIGILHLFAGRGNHPMRSSLITGVQKYILNRIAENPYPSPKDGDFAYLSNQANTSDDHEEAKHAFKEKT